MEEQNATPTPAVPATNPAYNTLLEQTQTTQPIAKADPNKAAMANLAGIVIENPTIALPILTNYADLMEAIQINFTDDEKPRVDRISVPSAGGLAFTIIDENGQKVPLANIKGIILHHQDYNIRWLKNYNELKEGEENPFCFSANGETGCGCVEMNIPVGQPCASCPYKQPGSDRNGGESTDCHDRCAVFTLKENAALQSNLDLPRTSLKNWNAYRNVLTRGRGVPYFFVVTKFGLEEDTSKGGKKFSAVTFAPETRLQPDEIKIIRSLREMLMPKMFVDYTVIRQMAAGDKAGEETTTGDPTAGTDEKQVF